MSAGAIFQEALRVLNRQHLPEVSQRDLLAALEAGRPGALAFLYEAGAEAGLPYQKLLTRATAIYFNFCAGNLADDLMDGDCTYLSEPFRIGPCVQFILQSLCFDTLMEAALRGSTLSSALRDLVAAGGQQLVEVRTQQWNAPLFREVAEGIAGRQWSAYMQILWCNTPLANRAATIGMNAGIAAHVVKDFQSQDPRFTTMLEADKREIIAWATAAAQALREEHLRCLDALLRTIDPVLQEAL
ncbi:MAG: hypothetical protein HYZ72_19510 [Deltaproteobacteria bacterium]|nr:hypothetical protein [Deltaproteobacteria bacterium]